MIACWFIVSRSKDACKRETINQVFMEPSMTTLTFREPPVHVERVHISRSRREGFFRVMFAWLWRILAGVFLCFNVFIVNYVTSIAVFGWLQRWMQTRVLKGWWKQSGWPQRGSFADFCATLGDQAPSPRPRWFWKERSARSWTILTPLHSLGVNFQRGLQGLLATYLLTGWGCLLMLYSWDFGWVNSFNKGYEQWWVGIASGWLGLLLFIVSMFYVPMALVHQAATGEFRAFFQFRFIRKLIYARLTAYLGLAMLFGLCSIVFEVMRMFVVSEDFPGNNRAIAAAEGMTLLRYYYLAWTVPFFLSLLLLRGAAAAIYRSAVLKALGQQTVKMDELHPTLALWLERLQIVPEPAPPPGPVARIVRTTLRWNYRRLLNVALFLVWFGFITRFYAGYFFHSSDALGFLNHPHIHLPCIDYTPIHLAMGRDE
jgi:hypothetical protein